MYHSPGTTIFWMIVLLLYSDTYPETLLYIMMVNDMTFYRKLGGVIMSKTWNYDDICCANVTVKLLTCANNSPYNFENFVITYENAIEWVHTWFMKRTLNISKYASKRYYMGNWLAFRQCTAREHSVWNIGCVYPKGLKRVIKPVFPIKCGRKS